MTLSPTVDAIRAVLDDLERPLTARERVILMATVARHRGEHGRDVIELADAARRAMRYRLRMTGTTPSPELAALLAAVDAILEPDTADEPDHDRLLADLVPTGGRPRADIDG